MDGMRSGGPAGWNYDIGIEGTCDAYGDARIPSRLPLFSSDQQQRRACSMCGISCCLSSWGDRHAVIEC